MNIDGHCHTKTIFHRGLHSPTETLSHMEFVHDPRRGRTSVSIKGRKRRTSAFSEYPPLLCAGGFPRSYSTAICCAASIMPRIDRIRLEYQNAEASQYASTMALQEKEPMVAAARMALWGMIMCQPEIRLIQINSDSEMADARSIKVTYSNRDELQFGQLAGPSAIQVIEYLMELFG